MASGAKKKAARRKKEKKAPLTNPNPNFYPLPSLHHQGEVEESFQTPRWHPEISGNMSSPEILRSKPTAEGEVEESFETPMWRPDISGNISSPEILRSKPTAEGYDSQNLDVMDGEDHVLDGEGSFVFVENPDDHLVVSEEVEEKETIPFHGVLVDNPEVFVPKPVDASVEFLGKGGKIVVWPYEEMPSVEFEAITNGIDLGLKDVVSEKLPWENSVTELDGDGGNVLPEIEDELIGQSMFIAEDVSVGSKVTVDNINSSGEALGETKLEKSVEEKCMPVVPAEVNGAAARIEFVPRNEVACGPLVERRATLWNCCGWLDVLIGFER